MLQATSHGGLDLDLKTLVRDFSDFSSSHHYWCECRFMAMILRLFIAAAVAAWRVEAVQDTRTNANERMWYEAKLHLRYWMR